MSLHDLFNWGGWDFPIQANYDWSFPAGDGWADLPMDYLGLNLPEATMLDLYGDAIDPNRYGVDFSLGVPGIDDMPLRESGFDLSLGGAIPLGYRNPTTGALETWGGAPIEPDPFGIRTGPPDDPFNFRSGISTPMSAGRVLQDARALRPGLPGLSDGRGGGLARAPFAAFPQIDSPGAANVSALPVPGVPVSRPPREYVPPPGFQPMPVDTSVPTDDSRLKRGLERLLGRL